MQVSQLVRGNADTSGTQARIRFVEDLMEQCSTSCCCNCEHFELSGNS